jgi:hypothetical protein
MTVSKRFVRSIGFAVAISMTGQLMLAQAPAGGQGAPQQGGGAPSTGTPGGGGAGTPGGANVPGGGIPGGGNQGGRPGQTSPFPDNRQQQQTPFPTDMPRPIILSGKVMLDDGVPPPEPVVIERVCNGNPRPEAYTDSKGRFSFQLGQNQHMMADASVGNTNDVFGGSPGFGRNDPMGRGGISERDLMGCEIRASLPGYRSEAINLAGRRSMDNPDVGTIILKRLANVEGRTFSITSATAPKDAKKAYEKARELDKKKKLPEAQKEYEKAVAAYPKYANAWFDLGSVLERQNNAEAAKKAYQEAINADAKLVKPYVQLAFMAAQLSDRVLKLNPYDFPQVYFYSAVANYNLQNFDAAEKSARDGVKADTDKRIPKLRQLLGMVLAQKNDVGGAMEQMKGYLSLLPANSPDIAVAKNQISQLEKMAQNQGAPKPADGQQ